MTLVLNIPQSQLQALYLLAASSAMLCDHTALSDNLHIPRSFCEVEGTLA